MAYRTHEFADEPTPLANPVPQEDSMGNKRAAKLEKRNRRKAAKEQQRSRRSGRLRAPLSEPGGMARLHDVDRWICTEHLWKAGSSYSRDFFPVLKDIDELNLFLLEEHKYHMAAVLIMMERKHGTSQWRDVYAELYRKADALFKLDGEGSDAAERDEALDQHMVAWLITGELAYINAVYSVSLDEESDCCEHACGLLDYYESRFDEVSDYLIARCCPPTSEDPPEDEGAARLRDILANSPDWRHIVYVRLEDSVYVIGTLGARQIKDAPMTFNNHPVIHRPAGSDDIVRHRKQLDRMDDPV